MTKRTTKTKKTTTVKTEKKGETKKVSVRDAAIRDRAKGALWGLLVGDCLGDVLQFGPPRKEGSFVTEMEAGGPFNTPAGYWTDDGSMALCIIDSVNRNGCLCIRDVADTFLKWYRDGYLSSLYRAFDVGLTTSRSLSLYALHGTLVNGSETNAGNGSLMRHAPAFLAALKMDNLGLTYSESDITHASSVVREQIHFLNEILDLHIFTRQKTIQTGSYADFGDDGKIICAPRENVRNSGFCVDTMDSALWAFHKTATFEDALIQAVNNGNDADSVGAVVGQIAGAYYGFKAIPERWVRKVKDWKKLDAMIERFLDIVLRDNTGR